MNPVKSPSYDEILRFAEKTLEEVLARASRVLDESTGISGYATKNPELTARLTRILFDEFCVLRRHHASAQAVSDKPNVPRGTTAPTLKRLACRECEGSGGGYGSMGEWIACAACGDAR